MTAADSYTPDSATASLEILTGPARGTASWLAGPTLDVSLDETDMIRIAEAGSEPLQDGVVARLHRSGESYEIEAIEENPLWINGERVESKQLEQRDLIEFGDNGPLSRYRLHRQGDRIRRSLGDMLDDAIDYTRASRKPRITRLQRAIVDFLYDFAVKTTVIFRIGVILALILLAWIAYQQYRSSIMLQQQAESSAHRLEDFSRSLTRTSEEALRPADLNRLRQELRHSLSDAAQRLEQLEQRGAASTRVIAAATPSIVFLQGAYGFRDIESQRMLRYQVDADGQPLFSLRGQPLLTLEGDGEIARRQFTGTAFLVGSDGALLTNRHVALPWEDDTGLEVLMGQGMEPVITRFLGYAPGIERAFPVESSTNYPISGSVQGRRNPATKSSSWAIPPGCAPCWRRPGIVSWPICSRTTILISGRSRNDFRPLALSVRWQVGVSSVSVRRQPWFTTPIPRTVAAADRCSTSMVR
jgi:hypothetical protein